MAASCVNGKEVANNGRGPFAFVDDGGHARFTEGAVRAAAIIDCGRKPPARHHDADCLRHFDYSRTKLRRQCNFPTLA